MQEIINRNYAGLCSETYCDCVETHFVQVEINNMKILIPFCEKHADEFENKIIGGLLNEYRA